MSIPLETVPVPGMDRQTVGQTDDTTISRSVRRLSRRKLAG